VRVRQIAEHYPSLLGVAASDPAGASLHIGTLLVRQCRDEGNGWCRWLTPVIGQLRGAQPLELPAALRGGAPFSQEAPRTPVKAGAPGAPSCWPSPPSVCQTAVSDHVVCCEGGGCRKGGRKLLRLRFAAKSIVAEALPGARWPWGGVLPGPQQGPAGRLRRRACCRWRCRLSARELTHHGVAQQVQQPAAVAHAVRSGCNDGLTGQCPEPFPRD